MEFLASLDALTLWSCAFILLCFLLSFTKKIRKFIKLTEYATLLTNLGILGTFVGISYALVNLDKEHLQSSVPSLIDGMKTAFFTSVFGLGLGMFIRFYSSPRYEKSLLKDTIEHKTGKTADDIWLIMFEQKQSIDALMQFLKDANHASITATNSTVSSMTSQMELLRQEYHNQHEQSNQIQNNILDSITNQVQYFASLKEIDQNTGTLLQKTIIHQDTLVNEVHGLQNSLNLFANNLTENNSKALITALNDLVKDFNIKITEQFGDNFKQLNIAVGKMLDWQTYYTTAIEKTQNALQTSIDSLSATEKSATTTHDVFAKIAVLNRDVLTSLDTFRELPQKINSQMSDLQSLSHDIHSLAPNLRTIASSIVEAHENIIHNTDKMSQQSSDILQNLTKNMDLIESYIKNSAQYLQEQQKIHQETILSLNKSHREFLDTEQQKTEASIQKILLELGNNLITLSSGFVQNYETLTTEYSKMIERFNKNMPR